MTEQQRLNRYTCRSCGGAIITVDRENGVTPFMLSCRASSVCAGMMESSFYRGVEGTPTFEWRRPTPEEYVAMHRLTREHIDKGGLEIYAIGAS